MTILEVRRQFIYWGSFSEWEMHDYEVTVWRWQDGSVLLTRPEPERTDYVPSLLRCYRSGEPITLDAFKYALRTLTSLTFAEVDEAIRGMS